MSSYVPPHLRATKAQAPQVTAVQSSVESRSATGTMASLTRSHGASKKTRTPLPVDDDFPVLGKKEVTTPSVTGSQRFSDLARSWGIQKKEEEETKKKQAHLRMAESQRLKEEEEKERRYFSVHGINATKLIAQSSRKNGDPLYDLGSQTEDRLEMEEDDLDRLDDAVSEEEEDSEYDLDADWNRRRNKNDLY